MLAVPEGNGDDCSTPDAELEASETLLSDERTMLYGCTRGLAL